jgi:hypothetical protein
MKNIRPDLENIMDKQISKFLTPNMIHTSIHCIRCINAIWINTNPPRMVKCNKNPCEYQPFKNWHIDRPYLAAAQRHIKFLAGETVLINSGDYVLRNMEENRKMVKAMVKKGIDLAEGRHNFIINRAFPTGPSFEDEPRAQFDYLQCECKPDEADIKMNVGFSFKDGEIVDNGDLYNFIIKLGLNPPVGNEFDTDELVGRKFSAVVVRKPSTKDPSKSFLNISKESINKI